MSNEKTAPATKPTAEAMQTRIEAPVAGAKGLSPQVSSRMTNRE